MWIRRAKDKGGYKGLIYGTLRVMGMAGFAPRDMRIVVRYPAVEWNRVWCNLHMTWTADTIKTMWFLVIHDLIPTNERLHKINLRTTASCDV
jgi:hypothetical protein